MMLESDRQSRVSTSNPINKEAIAFYWILSKSAPGYKGVQKALNRLIAELTYPNKSVFDFANSIDCSFTSTNFLEVLRDGVLRNFTLIINIELLYCTQLRTAIFLGCDRPRHFQKLSLSLDSISLID
ncbi:hypothetical protein GNF10_02445 [Nostoc sp. UCD121]|uniref:hypothetical protein n=1 Tax=unclassified Nostoc TaxID=2593658 RepID=UPI0016234BF5|nr:MULTISPECIES: hypothetical protein [unclassified Nostoc]MBC1223758.1 hypothetical protein [Nostoc sp. UCD120]MBC1274865.1 hypothetical protein [Nostoc sp. UCD121]MBC1299519.1 hypothetical protein [Nostoc sp. UCD122]